MAAQAVEPECRCGKENQEMKALEVLDSDKPTKRGFIMKKLTRLVLTVSFIASVFVLAEKPAMAQDPVKVDPKHYKIEFENDQVRILRITYGPHEKSVMHDHPAGQVVYITDAHVKFGLPSGKSEEQQGKAGQTAWARRENICRRI